MWGWQGKGIAGVSGYSGTPLPRKLGYAQGQRALLIGLPAHLDDLTGFTGFATRVDLPDAGGLGTIGQGPFDLVHLFERDHAVLSSVLAELRARLVPAGMIWVSWPKKASRVPTTLTEDNIRALALSMGLVDVKVCAVDAVWSGLKLMIPRALR